MIWRTDKRMVLQQAGYQSKLVGKAGTRGWIVYERTLDEVNAKRIDQMTSCFLKLYTPTRVCEIIIRNWSAGHPVRLQSLRLLSRHCMPESLPLHGGG